MALPLQAVSQKRRSTNQLYDLGGLRARLFTSHAPSQAKEKKTPFQINGHALSVFVSRYIKQFARFFNRAQVSTRFSLARVSGLCRKASRCKSHQSRRCLLEVRRNFYGLDPLAKRKGQKAPPPCRGYFDGFMARPLFACRRQSAGAGSVIQRAGFAASRAAPPTTALSPARSRGCGQTSGRRAAFLSRAPSLRSA